MDEKTTERYTGLMTHLRQTVSSDEFVKRHRKRDKDFTRHRCLSFIKVVLFLLNLIKRALQDELDEFFSLMQPQAVAKRVVTKSAFSQARQKLKYSAFVELNQVQVSYFYDRFDPDRWHGFRLLAIDGSMADLPNTAELRAHFGVWRPASGGECAKARLSQLFDVSSKITLDALIAPKAQGERALAEPHCQHLTETDLVLLDRGYPAFWLFAAIRARQAHFCARMSLTEWKVVAEFVASGQTEHLLHLKPSYPARKACQQRHLPIDPLPVRLLRIERGKEEPIVLLTSLIETDRFPYAELQALSLYRWPIETDYRHVKHHLEVENWTGLTVTAIYQDFHATVFTKNLAAIMAQPAQAVVAQMCASRQHPYQINWANLFSKLKDTVVHLFVAANPLPLFQQLWQQMTQTIEPVRPKRSFSRKKRVKPRRFAMAYKPLR